MNRQGFLGLESGLNLGHWRKSCDHFSRSWISRQDLRSFVIRARYDFDIWAGSCYLNEPSANVLPGPTAVSRISSWPQAAAENCLKHVKHASFVWMSSQLCDNYRTFSSFLLGTGSLLKFTVNDSASKLQNPSGQSLFQLDASPWLWGIVEIWD